MTKASTADVVGLFILALAVTQPVMTLASLKLHVVQCTDVKDLFAFRDYLGTGLLSRLAGILAIVGIAFCLYSDRQTLTVVFAMSLAAVIQSVGEVYYGLFQRHERLDLVARSMILKGVLSLAGLVTTIWLTDDIIWAILALAGTRAAVLLLHDLPASIHVLRHVLSEPSPWRASLPRFQFRSIARITWIATPLAISGGLVALNDSIPKYFVEAYWGTEQLAVFGPLAYVMVAASLAANSVGQSVTPRLARYYAAGSVVLFRRLVLRLLGIGGLIGVLLIVAVALCGRWGLTILYTAEYARHTDLLVLLAIGTAIKFLAAFTGSAMAAMRLFWLQLFSFVLGGVACVISCYFLVPAHGLWGAAVALIIVNTVLLSRLVVIWLYYAREDSICQSTDASPSLIGRAVDSDESSFP